ncbi:hypothetical protein APHAL10511_001617 [Amanita phalloides]|nr:hypothetical protein APHAL10511_001617 [Amanita phalloides]
MSSDKLAFVEQDNVTFKGSNDLPSYDELATHNGPNSRFGRWRGWIEKRARERYADLTPEDFERRRSRGWDLGPRESPPSATLLPSKPFTVPLHIQTSNLTLGSDDSTLLPGRATLGIQSLPFGLQRVPSSHLKICQFGSRFLPHATSQIRCLLPLMGDRYLLIGHDEGLSVLDMFPQEWNDSELLINKGPSEAIARQIWIGESVHQMTILEVENTGEGVPHGIVLALVGPELGYAKDVESPRTLRMYNLASLISLAKWAISTKGAHPLDLYKCNTTTSALQTPSKKHRPQSSIAKSFKQFMEPHESPLRSLGPEISPQSKLQIPDSYPRPTSPIAPSISDKGQGESSPDSQWELVDFENLPLRWANDHVPLASPGSRLVNQNILSYAFWCDENRKSRGGQLLAVATKNNILLYETPKGERAFRFVKDFYTPFQPRNVAFFHQNVQVQQESGRGHKRTDSSMTIRTGSNNNQRSSYVPSTLQDYGNHHSLFVAFDKKATWIRIADSAVGEMALFDDGLSSSTAQFGLPASYAHHAVGRDSHKESINSPTGAVRRIRHSIEAYAANKWGASIIKCDLPFEPGVSPTPSQVLFITRGRQTQVVPCPLPANYASVPPLWTVFWKSSPTHVLGRIYNPATDDDDRLPFLQIVAFGEGGIEVQEVPISLLGQGTGKGKGRTLEPSQAHEDLGGPVGFLCKGGHWDDFVESSAGEQLSRHSSTSDLSTTSIISYGSDEMLAKLKKQEGVYGWWCKDLQDWRVFWIGGTTAIAEDLSVNKY